MIAGIHALEQVCLNANHEYPGSPIKGYVKQERTSPKQLKQKIFEGTKEPLFGRATAEFYIKPLTPGAVSEIPAGHRPGAATLLPFYFTLFGGIPKRHSVRQISNGRRTTQFVLLSSSVVYPPPGRIEFHKHLRKLGYS